MVLDWFGNKYRQKRLEDKVEPLEARLNSAGVQDHLFRSIFHTEHPLILNEYTFTIQGNQAKEIVSEREGEAQLLKAIAQGAGLEKLALQYAKLKLSATIDDDPEAEAVIHTHPRDDTNTYGEKPGYSIPDWLAARKKPLGLFEYKLQENRGSELIVNGRLSIAYKGADKKLYDLQVLLREDGTGRIDKGNTSREAHVPKVAQIPQEMYESMVEQDYGCPLTNYAIKHAQQQIKEE